MDDLPQHDANCKDAPDIALDAVIMEERVTVVICTNCLSKAASGDPEYLWPLAQPVLLIALAQMLLEISKGGTPEVREMNTELLH